MRGNQGTAMTQPPPFRLLSLACLVFVLAAQGAAQQPTAPSPYPAAFDIFIPRTEMALRFRPHPVSSGRRDCAKGQLCLIRLSSHRVHEVGFSVTTSTSNLDRLMVEEGLHPLS